MKNGQTVAAFEREFASYVGAKYAIALCNGTATLHTALVSLGVKPGDKVATTPLTMSATSIAILQAGAVPVYVDVDERMWLMDGLVASGFQVQLPVSLYGLHYRNSHLRPISRESLTINDAAQTLCKHNPNHAFTSYSFQASKILSLGEGGCLVTDSEELATKAREFSSLGYRMRADQPRIDSSVIKSPSFERHHSMGWNYRMNDLTAKEGLRLVRRFEDWDSACDLLLEARRAAADHYRQAIEGCSWITPQYVPGGWSHDYWTYAVALESKELWEPFTQAIVRHGGEMPYGAWRLSYTEPGLNHFVMHPPCPIAESLQPRLVQFQTNDLASAERNAKAVKKAIEEIDRNKTEHYRHWARLMDGHMAEPQPDATGTPCS